MKAYRRRVAEARKMRADGKRLGEIAEALGSNVETVKGWVGKPRPS